MSSGPRLGAPKLATPGLAWPCQASGRPGRGAPPEQAPRPPSAGPNPQTGPAVPTSLGPSGASGCLLPALWLARPLARRPGRAVYLSAQGPLASPSLLAPPGALLESVAASGRRLTSHPGPCPPRSCPRCRLPPGANSAPWARVSPGRRCCPASRGMGVHGELHGLL